MAAEAYQELSDAHAELRQAMTQDPGHGRVRDRHRAEQGAAHRRPGRDAALAQRAAAACAVGLQRPPQAQAAARAPARDDRRGGRDRLGAGGGARVRVAAGAGNADPPHRPGHRARHLQPAAPVAARHEDRREVHADPEPEERDRAVRAPQQPAVGDRLPRLRVRLLGAGARGARALGGAVRRLRERRAGRDRPVPRVRPRQVGPDVPAHAAPAARLRGLGPRALERPRRAIPAARSRGEHPRGQRHDARRSTSTCCAARRSCRRPAHSS